MRAGWKHLGDAGGAQPGLAAADHGAQASTAGADHDDVIGVIFDRIGFSIAGSSAAICGFSVALGGHGLHSR